MSQSERLKEGDRGKGGGGSALTNQFFNGM